MIAPDADRDRDRECDCARSGDHYPRMTTQSAAVLDAPPIGTTMRALVKESAATGRRNPRGAGPAARPGRAARPRPRRERVRHGHPHRALGSVGAAELRSAADDLRPRDGRRRRRRAARARRASRSATGSPQRRTSSIGRATSAARAAPSCASTCASWACTFPAPSPST